MAVTSVHNQQSMVWHMKHQSTRPLLLGCISDQDPRSLKRGWKEQRGKGDPLAMHYSSSSPVDSYATIYKCPGWRGQNRGRTC